jgi:multiple sugar transport system permease protein
MSAVSPATEALVATGVPPAPARRRRSGGIRGHEGLAGWLFLTPVLVILGLFLIAPILMAAWVSVSDWTGTGSPLSAGVHYVGSRNYHAILSSGSLSESNFSISIRNNLYFVLFVVPLQTILSLALALVVNNRRLKGRSFFRTAYYFPTVTSSVAITVLFLFLFAVDGSVNGLLKLFGITGPNWTNNPDGLTWVILGGLHLVGIGTQPAALANHGFLGTTWYDWLAGPSIGMIVFIILIIWTSAGAYMLMYLAALQNIPTDIQEAADIDGAGRWKKLRLVLLPMLRPTTILILTLGLIGTWQLFDQVFAAGTQGGPGGTTVTPAFLSYQTSFGAQQWGQGSAIAFLLFALIVVLALLQRLATRDWSDTRERRAERRLARDRAGLAAGSRR